MGLNMELAPATLFRPRALTEAIIVRGSNMTITIRNICEKDFDEARRFAVHGMHLDWYATSKLELYFYSKYCWYIELIKATRAIGAYSGGRLIGVLLVDMKNEPKVFASFFRRIFVRISEFLIEKFYGDTAGIYEKANEEMLGSLLEKECPDGELNFFAIHPDITGQGFGTLLLNELQQLESGKLIYLFTDSGSAWQFYQRRGFSESGRQDVTLNVNGQDLPLTCFLFSKRL